MFTDLEDVRSSSELVDLIRKRASEIVFNMSTAKGRASCKTYSSKLIKYAKAVEDGKREDDFKKTVSAGVREIAASVQNLVTEWDEARARRISEARRAELAIIYHNHLTKNRH